MATAREESAYGAGGKFKKRPFRRSTQTTPYDRPPTALRNPTNISINSNNGWFSKLFDPAQRLIVSRAHRFFASVFRKRLTPPPPPPPVAASETEANQEETNMHQEQVYTDHASVQGAIRSHDDLNNSSDRGGVTELEQILKEKTFSRSDIDRLTALLQSRTAETIRDEQKIPEVISSKPVVLHNRKEAPLDTSFKENGIANAANQLISTPVVSSTVLDEDIASPAELAKAYMSSRPLKVSPSMPGMRGQAFREKSTVLSDQTLPSASPALSLVPRSSGHFGISENGYASPRSRGRSATYSMARAPYSRVHSTTALKGAGLTIDSVAGPSSSPQNTWEKNRLTGSKQGSLKRRSLVLDSDIGSIGPIRRIRQKHNLLSSKSLSLAASRSPLSVRGSGVADTIQYPSYSLQKPLLPSESTHGLTKLLTENGDNSLPSTSSTPIPSKSSEMASKILQQLDKLVSSREKSPTKLSPSTLHGPALKSLENADFSIFMENVQDNNRSNGSLDSVLPDFRDFSSQKRDKVEENGPTKIFSPKLIPATNGVDAAGIIKDNVPSTKMTNFASTNSTAHPHQQRDLSLQMSAREDYLELDDNDYCNGPPSMPLADGIDKLSASLDYKTTTADAITVEKSPACSDIQEKNYGAIDAGRGPVFASSTVPASSMTAQPAEMATLSTLTSNKAANESSGSPIFSYGEKFASPKESNDVPSSFSTGTTNVDKVPQFPSTYSSSVISEPPTFKFGVPLNSMPESSTSPASDAVGATDLVTKVPESDEADNRVCFRTPETSLPSPASTLSSTASIFSFGAPANGSTLNDGSLAPCPSSTSSPTPPLFSSICFNQNLFSSSTVSFATSSCVATSSATELSTAARIFNFGSSPVPSISTSPILATSGIESTEAKKNETGFGSVLFGASSAFAGTGSSTSSATSFATTGTGSSIFGSTLAAFSTTGSSIFGFSAGASTTAASSQGQASNSFAAGTAQASVNGTSVATTTQSMPTQFGSTALSKSFGLAANPTSSSSSSIFGSSTSAAKPFGSVPSFGLSSTSSSEANSISSSSGTATSLFGSSTNASWSSIISFTSAATATSSQPAYGSASSAFTFASAPSNNNDQMNMEDSSMAEDTVPTSTPAIAAFGQQQPITPPSTFVFGSTVGANPFQFGSQQNLETPQNPSPFNAGGGSFSLGTGGGDKSQRRIVKVRKQRKK